jgi:hypothetical protein
MSTLMDQSCCALVAQAMLVGLICVQRYLSIVTVVASGCGPVVSPRTGKRLGSPPRSSSRGLRIIGLMQALVSPSDSILVSLLLCL